jgi:hypothetical protein
MGRQKRYRNHPGPKNNLIQYSEGNEEKEYPVPDSNKTKINCPKKSNKGHKNTMKEEILQVITENFMEMLQDMVNQKIQEALKKFHDTTNKEYEKTQKKINEYIGVLSKNKSETENTINREVNELKPKIENI